MKVLVTGNEGYIGSVVAARLERVGHTVTGLDTGYYLDTHRRSPKTVGIDVRDAAPEALTGVDAIVHLAGLSNDPLGMLASDVTFEINAVATQRLASMAKEYGVRKFLFASTCSVYGGGTGTVTEESKPNPLTAYAESKLAAEQSLLSLGDHRFAAIALRCATVFGYSSSFRIDLVVNELATSAVSTSKIQLKSDGEAWRPFVHIDDLANVYLDCLAYEGDDLSGEVLNVGSTENNWKIKDVAETISRICGNVKVSQSDIAARDQRTYFVDFSKLQRFFPERRHRSLTVGVVDLVSKWKVKRPAGERRIDQLTELIESGRIDGSLRWQLAKTESQ